VSHVIAKASGGVGSPAVNITVFGIVVLVTLGVVFWVGRGNRTRAEYYVAGSAFTGPQNGVALAGDFLSAGSLLGITGAIAVFGYDGIFYAIGGLVAWLVALLLVAELLRNTGRYTMGDVLSFRMRQRPVRAAAATSTLVVSLFYLFAQMAGAGGLIALLLDIPQSNHLGQSIVIAVAGVLMLFYVLVGGMKGTTWVQIIKAGLLCVTTALMTVWMLGYVGFDLSALLGDAVRKSPSGAAVLGPGLEYGKDTVTKLDFVSLGLAVMLGPAGLPHVLMRFYTVPDAKQARRSVVWAIWVMGGFFLCLLVLGYGAMALVGPETILSAPGSTNSALPLLAYRIGGPLLLGLGAAVAFATILAVVAGATISASTSFAHDVYANILARGRVTGRRAHGKGARDAAGATPDQEVRVARRTAVVVGLLGIAGGIVANGQNIVFLVVLGFAIAASANLPTLLFTLFWRRFNTMGSLFSIYGGLASCLILIILSPAVTGSPSAMIPSVDIAVFPLTNPGLVTIPLSFALGVIGTYLGKPDEDSDRRFAQMETQALTGARPTAGARVAARPTPRPTPRPVERTLV
jgi:cation/acetate symporter